MPIYFWPFLVFFACCISQFWFVWKVRDRLVDCDPDSDILDEIEPSIFKRRIWRLTWDKRFKDLDDPELNRRVRNLKLLTVVAFASWLLCGIGLMTTLKR